MLNTQCEEREDIDWERCPSLHSSIPQIFIESSCVQLLLIGGIILPPLRKFAYPEIVNTRKAEVGEHWSLVGFPILNNCTFASFGFCNYLLVKIKSVLP